MLNLETLKSKERAAFRKKQDIWQKYVKARNQTNSAYQNLEAACRKCSALRIEKNSKYAALLETSALHREVWAKYNLVCDENESQIELLRCEISAEQREVQNYFNQADREYRYGDKKKAQALAEDGRRHKERCSELNEQIRKLRRATCDAKANAELFAPKINVLEYRRAKEDYERAIAIFDSVETKFNCLKTERDHYKHEYDMAQKAYSHLNTELKRRLKEEASN